MSSLFRIEVLQAQADHGYGETLKIKPIRFAVYSIGTLVIIIALAIYLSLSTFTRKYTVQGLIQPSGGEVTLSTSRGGTVFKVFMAEGDQVFEGQELIEIRRGEWTQSGEAHLENYKELNTQKDLLTTRLNNTVKVFALERSSLERDKETLDISLSLLEKQIALNHQKNSNIEKSLKAKKNLMDRGLLSQELYATQENDYLSQLEKYNSLLLEQNTKKIQLAGLENQLGNLNLTQQEQLISLKELLSSKNQEIIQAQAQQRTILRSPISGRVITMYARRGDQVSPQSNLVVLSDSDYKLMGDLYIPSRSIGFVKPGLEVLIKYDAFPYQKFGLYKARIFSVSETIYSPNDLQTRLNIPITIQEPSYRVRIDLEKQYVLNGETQVPLQNGMSMIAEIEYDRRTLIEWLLSPLQSIKGKTVK